MRTKVVAREISDQQCAFCFTLPCTIRNLSFESSTFRAQIFCKFYISSCIPIPILITISRRSTQFEKHYRIKKQEKNRPIKTLQTLKSFFSKTARFWEKFIRAKVVKRKISDYQNAFLFFSRTHCFRDIWEKQEKTSSFKKSIFSAQIYFKNYKDLLLHSKPQ